MAGALLSWSLHALGTASPDQTMGPSQHCPHPSGNKEQEQQFPHCWHKDDLGQESHWERKASYEFKISLSQSSMELWVAQEQAPLNGQENRSAPTVYFPIGHISSIPRGTFHTLPF